MLEFLLGENLACLEKLFERNPFLEPFTDSWLQSDQPNAEKVTLLVFGPQVFYERR